MSAKVPSPSPPEFTWTLRRARWLARVPRLAAALVGLILALAGLRAILAGDPPVAAAARPAAPVDLALHGFAAEFARRYLAHDERDPQARDLDLSALVGPALGQLELSATPKGTREVLATRVVQDQEAIAGGRLVTVAALTDPDGLLHLSVPVRRDGQGALALAGHPALVGAPLTARSTALPARRSVQDPELERVAARAVTNYLAGDAEDLEADLAPGARVSLPALAFTVRGRPQVAAAGEGGVLVTVRAASRDGAIWTLTYELAVTRQDRWYVLAVQTFPDQP